MRGHDDNSGCGELVGLVVICAIFLVVAAIGGHWFEKGHWEETGRIVPESTTFIPMKVGKDMWMPMPITTPAHPEKVWVPERESEKKPLAERVD